MFSNLTFPYPFWFLGFCVLAGVVYSMALYFRDRRFHGMSKNLNRILGALRFLAVALISLLLLSPMLKSTQVEVRKPVVIIAQDNSESVRGAFGMDSAQYAGAVTALKDELANDYDVKAYSFGSSVREGLEFNMSDKSTNISSVLESVFDLYSNQNLGAVILATDGIFNEGSSPLYSGGRLNAPVFGIALGDTTQKKDLYIKKIFNNKIAYLGDKFSLEVDIAAFNCAGGTTKLTVSKIAGDNTKSLHEEVINLDKNDFFVTKQVIIETDKAGIERYRVTLSSVSGEASTANNSREIFIEVLDARQKVLILANAPHPDISALRQVITNTKNYACDIQFVKEMTGGVAQYDFVILHQVPGSNGAAEAAIAEIKAKKIPRLYILGAQSNLAMFNQQQLVLSAKGNIAQTNTVEPRLAKGFSLFTITPAALQSFSQFPPLIAPFGEYVPGANASVLMTQKIGAVETPYPLIMFGEDPSGKIGVISGEGLWKWRYFDFLQRQNFDIADEVIGKTVQYLALKEDKRRFRVYAAKNVFNENEPIQFDAELYNASYELVNEPDAFLSVVNADGKRFNFTFTKNGKSYNLNAGYFPVGNYSYEASTTINGELLKAEGRFSVQPVQLEQYATTADHNLLRVLAANSGGKVVAPNAIASLADMLRNENKLPSLRYESTHTQSIINLKWIFFLLLGLLSAEWFLRRYYGAY